MKVLNFGSLNLDYVYTVDHMVAPGETLSSAKREVFCGGKGLNQSIALAKAGVPVFHAGLVGPEGGMLLDAASEAGVNLKHTKTIETSTGHAIIQIDKNGQNCILLFGGANQEMTKEFIDNVLSDFEEGDIILLQNEINMLDYIIDSAYERGMKVILNPSPFNDLVEKCDLSKVYLFFANEVEGYQITGEKEPEAILDAVKEKYPEAKIVLTLGGDGACYQDGDLRVYQDVFPVDVVDTTAAGDTFTGYFIASMIKGMDPAEGLKLASKASSIAVSRKGAAPSIPVFDEVEI